MYSSSGTPSTRAMDWLTDISVTSPAERTRARPMASARRKASSAWSGSRSSTLIHPELKIAGPPKPEAIAISAANATVAGVGSLVVAVS